MAEKGWKHTGRVSYHRCYKPAPICSKKKNAAGVKTALSAVALTAVLSAFTTVNAAGNLPYYDYNLYSGYQNNYTNVHLKTTNDQYMWNQVTAMSGAPNGASFWAITGNNSSDAHGISNSYRMYKGERRKIFLTEKLTAGGRIQMGMKNCANRTGKVSGEVDFR